MRHIGYGIAFVLFVLATIAGWPTQPARPRMARWYSVLMAAGLAVTLFVTAWWFWPRT